MPDRSFTGLYRVDNDTVIIFPDGSDDVLYGTVTLKLDSDGFLASRRLTIPDHGEFGNFEDYFHARLDA